MGDFIVGPDNPFWHFYDLVSQWVKNKMKNRSIGGMDLAVMYLGVYGLI